MLSGGATTTEITGGGTGFGFGGAGWGVGVTVGRAIVGSVMGFGGGVALEIWAPPVVFDLSKVLAKMKLGFTDH